MPAKIPASAVQKMMSGVLFSIGTAYAKYANKRDFGTFVNKMVQMGRADEAVAGHLFYYVKEGAAAGSGRMSRGMALCAKQWVQSVLRGTVELENGQTVKIDRLSRYVGPAIEMSRSARYQDWINETPFFKVKGTVSYLTGAMAAAVIATPSAAGGYIIKIDGRRWTRPVVSYSNPLRFAKRRIPVAAYAMWQEKGVAGLYPARPWISGSMVAWVQSFDGVWGKLLEEQLNEIFWDTFDAELASGDSKFMSLDTSSDAFKYKMEGQMATASVVNMLESAGEALDKEARDLDGTSRGSISSATAARLFSSKAKGLSKKRLIAGLVARGLTRAEAKAVADKIVSGE